jgi:hypothetical protein
MIRPLSYSDNTHWRGSNLALVSSLVLPGRLHFVKKQAKSLYPNRQCHIRLVTGQYSDDLTKVIFEKYRIVDSNLVLVRSLVLLCSALDMVLKSRQLRVTRLRQGSRCTHATRNLHMGPLLTEAELNEMIKTK